MAVSTNHPIRVVGYCRTSGEAQRDNTSIPRQREDIEAMAQAEGWTLVRHYVDECKSGAKTEGRDAFNKMLADAARKQFDMVVFFDVSRLGRDGVNVLSTSKFLKDNFSIHTVDTKRQFDSRDRRKTLTNFVHAGVSEHERLTIMERMIGARVKQATEGLPWSSCTPVGRAWVKTCGCDKKCKCYKGKWYVTEQGKKIAEMLTRYADGEPLTRLSREYGYKDESHITRQVRRGQLAARPYTVVFNAPEIDVVNLAVEVPAVPPVISQELYERVKQRMAGNRKKGGGPHRHYPLVGFLFCGHCAHSLSGSTVRDRTYYRHSKCGGKDCGWNGVAGKRIEERVLEYLYMVFTDEPSFNLAVELALPSASVRREKQASMEQARADLAAVEKEIGNLVAAVAKGVDPGLLLSKQEELKATRAGLKQRLGAVEGELASLPDPVKVRAEASYMRHYLAVCHGGGQTDWRREPPENIRRFLEYLFGLDPAKDGLGVFVHREGGETTVRIHARLKFQPPDGPDGEPICTFDANESDDDFAYRERPGFIEEMDRQWRDLFDGNHCDSGTCSIGAGSQTTCRRPSPPDREPTTANPPAFLAPSRFSFRGKRE
jgi:DNA invertase Pin-like site-specific DNA recombinase